MGWVILYAIVGILFAELMNAGLSDQNYGDSFMRRDVEPTPTRVRWARRVSYLMTAIFWPGWMVYAGWVAVRRVRDETE